MRPGLFIVGMNGGLFAANGRTKEDMRALNLQPGQLTSAQVLRCRSPKLNALVHAVLAHLAEGFGVTPQTVKTRLKLALGYCDLIEKADGTIAQSPHSVSFDDMDESDFREFWKAAEEIVCSKLLPELPEDEQSQIVAILNGGPRERRQRRGR
jgi:DNA-binding MarR family transcriptional regulator